MQIVKPEHVSVLYRTFERQEQLYFVATIQLCFELGKDGGAALRGETEMWEMILEETGGAVFDEGMFKPRGELLVHALACPRNPPQPGCQVRVSLARAEVDGEAGAKAIIDKRLYAVGDRVWQRGGVASDPEPFAEMKLGWHNAFGGEGWADNPLGCGLNDEEGIRRLPNVELPSALISSPGDRPKAAGFGARDMRHPERRKHFGKDFDGTRGMARDTDWALFLVAPSDQVLPDYFEGREHLLIEHLHPDKPRITAQLPGLRGRSFFRRSGKRELEELPLRLDTVQLFPHRDRGVLTWRGITEVQEHDAEDIEVWLSACEEIGQARPLSHYAGVIDERIDRKHPQAGLSALHDTALVPAHTPSLWSNAAGTAGAMLDNVQRGLHAALDEEADRLAKEGIEMPRVEPEPRPDTSDPEALRDALKRAEEDIEKHVASVQEQLERGVQEARVRAAAMGIDYDAATAEGGGPPSFRADEELAKMKARVELGRNAGLRLVEIEERLADPKLIERLRKIEAMLHQSYRANAQWMPVAASRDRAASQDARARVEAAKASGESMAGWDLTGSDLSELDLSQADLRGAYLEACNLERSDLTGADLSGAVLVRARLHLTKVKGARWQGANLSAASLDGCDLGGARWEGLQLIDAQLREVGLSKAVLRDCDFMGASLQDCDLSGVDAKGLMMMGVTLDRIVATDARLVECVFVNCKGEALDVRRSTLTSTTLMGCELEGVVADASDATNLRLLGDCVLDGCSFAGATLCKASFERASLIGGDFRKADLRGAILIKCCFDQADWTHAVAVDAIMTRSSFRGAKLLGVDLRNALLPNAHLEGTDLSGSQLFRSDLTRVFVSADTKLGDAEIRYCTFTPRKT